MDINIIIFIDKMNEQLKRIKSKDFSSIDEKLFQNMLRTDNLTSTLSHLTQFQQFLMQQINNINSSDKRQKTASLRSSITRNFDTLRQSLVHCSRIVSNTDSLPTSSLKRKTNLLQNQLNKTKEEFKEMVTRKCQETKLQAEYAMNQMISAFERERNARRKLEDKLHYLSEENQTLKKELLLAKNMKEEIIIERHDLQTVVENKVMCSAQTEKYQITEEETQILGRIEPLREKVNGNAMVSIPSFSDKEWKIERRYSTAKEGAEARRRSLVRTPSNYRMPNKQNIDHQREQQALLSKGVREERHKSRQKIKIFSML